MNKTISITLAGLVFNIEENAYPVLKEYLDSLKQLFSAQTYGQEVVNDIEARIAEQFKKKLSETKVEVVTLEDVNKVIKEMGTASDFGGNEEKTEAKQQATAEKKLYRSSDDVMVAGVASGIAAYLGWDPIIIRIAFGLATIFGGWGIAVYILFWILMPEAKTSGQKLEMRGAAVTIKQLEQTVKEKSEQVRNSGFFGSVGRGISKIVKLIAIFIRGIIGSVLVFASAVALFATTFTAAVMLFNRNSPNMDPILTQVLVGSEYYFGIVLALIAIVIPLLLLIMSGIAIVRKKSIVNFATVLVMTIVWFAAASGTGVVISRAAPEIEAAINEPQHTIERQLDVKDFQKIEAHSNYEVKIVQGTKYSALLKADERYMEEAEVKVENNTLKLNRKDRFVICFFCFDRPMTVEITMPKLDKVEASGATKVTADGFKSDNFEADLSGASRLNLNKLETKKFTSEISGASKIEVTGKTVDLIADLSGASQVEAREFVTDTATIKASGASKVYVDVIKTLNAEVSGASRIYYLGNPQTTIKDSGSSRVEKF